MPTINIPKLSTIKEIIYLIGIAIAVIFYMRDKWKEEAVRDAQFKAIMEQLEQDKIKWDNQLEINGQFYTISRIVLDSDTK
jgi:hypothetical protein